MSTFRETDHPRDTRGRWSGKTRSTPAGEAAAIDLPGPADLDTPAPSAHLWAAGSGLEPGTRLDTVVTRTDGYEVGRSAVVTSVDREPGPYPGLARYRVTTDAGRVCLDRSPDGQVSPAPGGVSDDENLAGDLAARAGLRAALSASDAARGREAVDHAIRTGAGVSDIARWAGDHPGAVGWAWSSGVRVSAQWYGRHRDDPQALPRAAAGVADAWNTAEAWAVDAGPDVPGRPQVWTDVARRGPRTPAEFASLHRTATQRAGLLRATNPEAADRNEVLAAAWDLLAARRARQARAGRRSA